MCSSLYLKCSADPILVSAHFNAPGSTILIPSITLNGKVLAQNGTLVLHVQNAPDPDFTLVQNGTTQLPQVQKMVGRVDSIQVEQNGPVRAVIKVGFMPGL